MVFCTCWIHEFHLTCQLVPSYWRFSMDPKWWVCVPWRYKALQTDNNVIILNVGINLLSIIYWWFSLQAPFEIFVMAGISDTESKLWLRSVVLYQSYQSCLSHRASSYEVQHDLGLNLRKIIRLENKSALVIFNACGGAPIKISLIKLGIFVEVISLRNCTSLMFII